jgi:hypothetical protein
MYGKLPCGLILSKKSFSGTGFLRSLTRAAVDMETQCYPEVPRAKTYMSLSRKQEVQH